MSESTSLRGGCLCGAITYEVDPPFARMIHCHCSRCRKGTGTGHATNLLIEPAQLHWRSGEQLISRFELPNTAAFGKWFCSRCGAPVPRLSRSGRAIVPAGSLDAAPPLLPSDHIFWSSRAEWGCPSGGLPTHEAYPPHW
ncbi:GFA family protein [Solimonas soli]|uniref:GFA family protein n=1 Tax=Solimonas soli TaxID=413479 RepID=UPI000480B449|nr:GFA family protein [Solimonas soli]